MHLTVLDSPAALTSVNWMVPSLLLVVYNNAKIYLHLDVYSQLASSGVTDSGYGGAFNDETQQNRIHQSRKHSISTDFSREDILELGRKTPYARPATFPIEVTQEIEAITTSGDFVNAYEFGDEKLNETKASGNNTSQEIIFLCTRAGYAWDLGAKNRLASVSYGGGDATGGNATCTYSFTNFNELDVQHLTRTGFIGFGVLERAWWSCRSSSIPNRTILSRLLISSRYWLLQDFTPQLALAV